MSADQEVVRRKDEDLAKVPAWVVWLLGLGLPETNKRVVWITIFGAAVCVAAALNTVPVEGETRLTVSGAWAITMGMVLIVLAALGMQRLYRVGGILINERNVMSLTRFQITAWTVMIGSAILAVGLSRAFHPDVNPAEALDLVIPAPVWQLLGISGGSTLLATMIQKNKRSMEPSNPEATANRTAAQTGEHPDDVKNNTHGVLYGNKTPFDARFMDMLEGDEVGNTTYLDIAKVQMFFFTVIALLLYGGVLWDLLYSTEASMITEFPGLTETMVTITGVSHATYIGTKAITQTNTVPK